ncbi:glycosyl transferase [Chitiniphilus shinanonensis]|uniref:Glycosyl transferase n=1 Tax=Chitiniphilus shinanonensis TaxID=553088 RepID=A0ABQ6BVP3_9NEIS|nr:glycosyltransferase [Chitiniphilus shinanonensis]GLS03834.1 glycosyl transferase [Chitiniphilus shinanonensis]
MSDLVSIVMPAYNAGPYIDQAIESVRAQTWQDWELLVVDDGSTDDTIAQVQRHAAADARVRLLHSGGQRSPARARNVAIAASCGRYIAFLDSDDAWLPNKLERQVAAMRQHGALLCYSSYYKMDRDGRRGDTPILARPWVDHGLLLKSNFIGCLTAIYDAAALGRVPMPDIRKRQDLALWLVLTQRIAAEFGPCRDKVLGLPEPLALYREHSGTVSSDKKNAAAWQWKLYREVVGLGRLAAAYYFVHYAVRGFAKYLK